jgi:hypothetical protein
MADKVRPIDANALRLMKVAECAGHTIEYAWGWKACVEYCKNEAPTIEAEPVNGWISVEDRLPRLGQRVMAFCRAGILTFLRYDGEVWFEMSSRNEYLLSFVTHWQPLPEPPKEEDYDLLLRPNEE